MKRTRDSFDRDQDILLNLAKILGIDGKLYHPGERIDHVKFIILRDRDNFYVLGDKTSIKTLFNSLVPCPTHKKEDVKKLGAKA